MSTECPDVEQLSAFQAGRLSEVDATRIAGHLETCASCEQVVASDTCRAEWLAPLARHEPLLEKLLSERGFRRVASQSAELETPRGDSAVTRVDAAQADSSELPRQVGPYRLVRLLGRGGMGEVFEAIHAELDKRVALKLLPSRHLRTTAAERFRREMKALGRIEHPHVVTAYDAGEADGRCYLAMEHLNGENLSELLKRQGPLKFDVACELVRQAALGVGHIHSMGLVHRDLKPSNLLLTSQGIVKVLDMGLAIGGEQDEPLSVTGQAVGTSAYMSPEQLRDSRRADQRSDVYSLGATLAALLTGCPPPPGAARLLEDEAGPRLLNVLAAGEAADAREIPEPLVRVLARMLAENPDERYQTAADVAEAVARFAADAGPLAGIVPQAGPSGSRGVDSRSWSTTADAPRSTVLPRKRRRRVWQAWLGAMLAACLLAAGVVVVIRITSDQEQGDGQAAAEVRIDVQGPAVVTVNSGGPAATPTAHGVAQNDDDERAAAEWVLSVGGTVTVVSEFGEEQFKPPAALPGGPLQVVMIGLPSNRQATDRNLSRLAGLERLEWLDLTQTPITDQGLQHLAGLKQLRGLLLAWTRITSAGLEHLRGLTGLTNLHLLGTRVDDAGMPALRELKRLEWLALRETKVSDRGLQSLTALESLAELHVQECPVTIDGVLELQSALPGCEVFWSLPESTKRLDQAGRERAIAKWVLSRGGEVTRHPHGDITRREDLPEEPFRIRNISLWKRGLADDDLAWLQQLSVLEGLTLSANPLLTDEGLDHLTRIKTLRWLYVGWNQIGDAGVLNVNRLTRLESLDLGGTEITDRGLAVLDRLHQLRELRLPETRISDAGLEHLRNFPNLLRLDLYSTAITDAGLERLVTAAPQLKYLRLELTRVTDAGLAQLGKLRDLKEVNLKQTAVTSQGIKTLQRALPDCRVEH